MAAPQYRKPHQEMRAALLSRLRPGAPCGRCGEPMWPQRQRLELDHVVPVTLGGAGGPKRLTHAWCNRRGGGEVKTVMLRVARSCPSCSRGRSQVERMAAVRLCARCKPQVLAVLGVTGSQAPRPALSFFD